MPLVRLSNLLGWSHTASPETERLTVVVYRQGERNVGLVVPRIVDIVGGPRTIEDTAEAGAIVSGSTLIEGRVTDVIDLAAACQVAGVRRVKPLGDSAC